MSSKYKYDLNSLDKAAVTLANVVDWYKGIEDEKILSGADKLKTRLLRLANSAKAAHEVLPVATTIGVFGSSQAGKSYLVSALASNGGGKGLEVTWNSQKISFFAHLNPVGGDREATGLVTRFTSKMRKAPSDYPIVLKVIKECDLLKILVNSYFLDIDYGSEDGKAYLLEHDAFFKDQNALKNLFSELNDPKYLLKDGEKTYFTKQDVVSLADYVNTHSNVSCLKEEQFNADGYFFLNARNIISKLNKDGRVKLFSTLWHQMPAFDNLYKALIDDFDKLEGATTVFANIDSIVEKNEKGELIQKANGTLVNVKALDRLLDESYTDNVNIALDDEGAKVVNLRHCALAAITCEISFPQAENSGVKSCDVLDFPGARSREKMDTKVWRTLSGKADFTNPNSKEYSACQFLLRGKVGYLIERYCERHEIDVLLCCQTVQGQAEVSELTPYITNWIDVNVGATAQSRKGKINPLVGVFTKFDYCFTRNMKRDASVAAASDINGTITMAMQKFKADWVRHWTDDKPFDQFFFARRPNLSGTELVYDVTNSENGIVETGIKDSAKPFIDEYIKDIVKDPCMEHVYRFKEFADNSKAEETPTVNEVLKPSDGGVSYLVQFINDTYGKDFTQGKDNFYLSIQKEYQSIEQELSKFASLDSSKKRDKLKQIAIANVKDIVQCDNQAGILADLRSFIEIDEKEAREDYLTNFTSGVNKNSFRFAAALTKMRDDKLDDIAAGKAFNSIVDNILYAWDENAQKSVSEYSEEKRIAECSFFLDESNQIITDKNVLKQKISALLQYLTHEMKVAYRAANIENKVADILEKNESQTKRKEDIVDSQCAIALKIISDFNTYLYVGSTPKNIERPFNSSDENRELFTENALDEKEHTIEITKDMVSRIKTNYLNDHFSVLVHMIANVNTQAASIYKLDSKKNDELCALLTDLEKFMSIEEASA